ncbi:MAG: lactonase family protein [Acidobacteriia bacterium]|nr:lactonase family protein [Terriglobia bacterium]
MTIQLMRRCLPLFVLVSFSSGQAQTPPTTEHVAVYASVGAELTQYDLDIGSAALVKRGSVTLPASVQEAWPHPSHRYLYVAWSNGGPGASGNQHGVSAFRIDPVSGALQPHGRPAPIRSRPIHITVDIPGTHALVAYNDPSGVSVHRIASDGTVGSEVQQPAGLDVGIYGHQVRVDPSNRMVILVTRGNGPAGGKPEDPGALKIFGYNDGVLTNRASIAPGGGFNFQPRHLDFHASRKWIFVTLERQNKLQVYRRLNDETIAPEPLFTKETLTDPSHIPPGQVVASIHMHPNGRFVYVANRASGTENFNGQRVFVGGENSIAVFAINQDTGEPALVQNIDTRGMHPRTFAIDPSGRVLVVGNQMQLLVRDGNSVRTVPASLTVYRIRGDGKLEFAHKYDVETGGGSGLFWMGLVPLPAN